MKALLLALLFGKQYLSRSKNTEVPTKWAFLLRIACFRSMRGTTRIMPDRRRDDRQ
jgi:hypothetical protein